ncbi:cold-shock protein [Nocardia arthritidis]|nr:cold shock domain-containing protein [Nocardia arthritidis]
MPTGVIKFYLPQRGYGFIAGTDDAPDMYVPAAGLADPDAAPPQEGDTVTYTIAHDDRGRPRADHVLIVHRASTPTTSARKRTGQQGQP